MTFEVRLLLDERDIVHVCGSVFTMLEESGVRPLEVHIVEVRS